MKKKINQVQAMGTIISKKDGKFFGVKFIKKDGTIRKMSCKRVVKKEINGKGMSYNPLERGLIPVYDLNKKGYRTINLATIIELNMDGINYDVINN
jgi:hypothetical protein